MPVRMNNPATQTVEAWTIAVGRCPNCFGVAELCYRGNNRWSRDRCLERSTCATQQGRRRQEGRGEGDRAPAGEWLHVMAPLALEPKAVQGKVGSVL